jgi:hypothetical protein
MRSSEVADRFAGMVHQVEEKIVQGGLGNG